MEQEYCISNLELVAGFNNGETVFFQQGNQVLLEAYISYFLDKMTVLFRENLNGLLR